MKKQYWLVLALLALVIAIAFVIVSGAFVVIAGDWFGSVEKPSAGQFSVQEQEKISQAITVFEQSDGQDIDGFVELAKTLSVEKIVEVCKKNYFIDNQAVCLRVMALGKESPVEIAAVCEKINSDFCSFLYSAEEEKIHWQELARPSAKSLLQPFGSATGDFYLRFHKPQLGIKATTPTEIDEARFERIVVETTKELLAERGEPTPYTIIINYIDPVLAKHGYFLALHTGLDVKAVLKNHLDQEFILVAGTIGGAEGELWWFKDTSIIPHFEIPLSERVEQTVLRKLMSEYKVTFTQLWEAVSVEFPNALTSDSISLMDILQEYAKKETGGFWILKPIVRQRQTEHAQIISIIADIGDKLGFRTWVGIREQNTTVKVAAGATTSLIEFCRPKKLELAGLIQEQLDDVVNIDLLWYKEGKICALFEVENTTAMTEALRRASSIPYNTDKYMVLPDERVNQLTKKMKSPMFGQQFEGDGWQVLYYDALYNNERYLKQGKKQINDVVGIRVGQRPKKTESTKQLGLF